MRIETARKILARFRVEATFENMIKADKEKKIVIYKAIKTVLA